MIFPHIHLDMTLKHPLVLPLKSHPDNEWTHSDIYNDIISCSLSLNLCINLTPSLSSLFQEAVAQWSVRWQLRDRGPDAAQHLLSPPDAGPDGNHRPGRLPPGPQPDLLQAAGTQRGDPRHDPPRPGLPGRHNLPPRLQRFRDKPLTGAQELPAPPSFPTLTSPITAAADPPKTASTSLCSGGGGPAPSYLAFASSCVSAAPDAQLQADPCPPPRPTLEPEPDYSLLSSCSAADSDSSWLDFAKPPDLFSSHSCSNTTNQILICHTHESQGGVILMRTLIFIILSEDVHHTDPRCHM